MDRLSPMARISSAIFLETKMTDKGVRQQYHQ
jgi:hypothetical protein